MSLTTKEVCVCDGEGCGVEMSGSSKGWWIVIPAHGVRKCSNFQTWDDDNAHQPDAWHLCGLTCLYKAIDKLAQKILKESAVKA